MSEEMKNGTAAQTSAQTEAAPTTLDKLNEAKAAAAKADASAKTRRAEDRKKKTESSRAEKQKVREAEQKRLEDEKRKAEAREKRLAQLAYAENYRERQREEQKRRQAARDAKRKAREDALAKRLQDEDEARIIANQQEAEGAELRNAQNDELLRKYSETREAELKRRAELASEAAERSARETSYTPTGPIIISEDGKELLAAIEPELIYKGVDLSALDGIDSPIPSELNDEKDATAEAAPAEDAPAEAPVEDTPAVDEAAAEPVADDTVAYTGIDLSALAGLGAPLSSESALEDYLDELDEAKQDTVPAPVSDGDEVKEGKPRTALPEDYIISIDEQEIIAPTEPKLIGTRKIKKAKEEEAPVTNEAPVAEEAPAAEPERVVISIPSTTVSEPVPAEKKPAEKKPAKTVKTVTRTITKTAPAPTSSEPMVVRIYDSKNDRAPELDKYLRGYGTYALVTKKAGFADDVDDRRKSIADEISVPKTAEGGRVVREPSELSDDYEFSAGFVYTYEALGLVDRKKGKRERKERMKQLRHDMKRAKYGLPPLYAVVADDVMPDEVDEGEIDDGESLTEAAVAATAIATAAAAIAAAERVTAEDAPSYESAEDYPVYEEVPDSGAEAAGIALAAAGGAILNDEYRKRLDEAEALKARRDELAAAVAKDERANRDEIIELRTKENDAMLGSYQAEIDSINDRYSREIEELTARRDQIQSSYEAEKARLEESIAGFTNPYSTENQHVELATRGTDGSHVVTVAYSSPTEPAVMPERRSLPEGESDEKRALERLADGEIADKIVTKMNKRELKDRLRRAERKENKLKRSYKKIERRRVDSTERLVALMALKRELLESYVSDLNYAIVADNSRYTKKYARLVSETTGEYNGLIDDFCVLTGSKTPTVNENIAELIVSGVGCPPIPVIDYVSREKLSEKPSPKREEAERRREQKQLLREDKALQRDRRQGLVRDQEAPDAIALTPKMVKKMMKLDLKTVKARCAYRKATIKYQLSLSNYHFNENTRASQAARVDSNARLRAMRRDTKKLYKVTKANNKRYARVMNGTVKLNRVKHEAERQRIEVLRQRIIARIVERAEINTRLMALYSDDGRGKKNVRDKIARVRLKAARRSFKKQLHLYRKSKRYFVPMPLKEEAWALMNERTNLAAYLAECKYRKRHEKPKGSLKRALKEEIRNTKRSIKYTERDIYRLLHKMKKKNEKQPSVKAQIIWIVVLAVLVVGGVACAVFYQQILDFIMNLIGSFKG